MTEGYKCKITNFTLSHKTQYVTSKVVDIDVVKQMMRWMAPAKLKVYQKPDKIKPNAKIEPYTYACETFR